MFKFNINNIYYIIFCIIYISNFVKETSALIFLVVYLKLKFPINIIFFLNFFIFKNIFKISEKVLYGSQRTIKIYSIFIYINILL